MSRTLSIMHKAHHVNRRDHCRHKAHHVTHLDHYRNKAHKVNGLDHGRSMVVRISTAVVVKRDACAVRTSNRRSERSSKYKLKAGGWKLSFLSSPCLSLATLPASPPPPLGFFFFFPLMERRNSRKNLRGARVGLVYDERMCSHSTPDKQQHPENPNRIKAIWRKLQSRNIPQSLFYHRDCVLLVLAFTKLVWTVEIELRGDIWPAELILGGPYAA
ncbi:hypothetical protein ACLOJK_002473 [Asimina triloba]